jgi:hypothetical protein
MGYANKPVYFRPCVPNNKFLDTQECVPVFFSKLLIETQEHQTISLHRCFSLFLHYSYLFFPHQTYHQFFSRTNPTC